MDITARLFNICNPMEPPVSDAYVDFGPARGDEAVIATLERRIRRAGDYTHLLFSGHPGSGKSTELLRLCDRFKNPAHSSLDRYFPVYMDADDYVNRLDVAVTEILLAIISSVAESLRDKENIHLESSYLRSRWDEIKGLALSEVELEKVEFSLPEIGKFTTKLKKADANSRRQVRDELTPQLPSILDEINLVLAQARIELKKLGYQDLVLVVDNLEKVQDVKSSDAEKGMFYELFVVGGQQLSDIEAHTVLSIPLPLIHSPQRMELVNTFGEEPRVLPMVKVAEKDGEPCGKGLGLMCEVLSRRFKIAGKAKDVFDSDDTFRRLCQMSGGHVRNLLIYFRSSLDYVDSLPITAQAVERGVRQHINAYSRSIPQENWELLAQLHLNPDKDIPQNDAHQGMLGDLSILEYMNGGEPWYAVNPVVRELEKFKRAVERLEEDE